MSEQSKMHKQGIWPILVMLLVYLFLYMPILVVVVYSFNQNTSNMTFQGFTLRWYAEVLHGSNLWGNLFLSLKLSFVSMIISVVLGTLATIGTYRYEFRLKKYLNGLLYIPLVIPELVIGLPRDLLPALCHYYTAGTHRRLRPFSGGGSHGSRGQ